MTNYYNSKKEYKYKIVDESEDVSAISIIQCPVCQRMMSYGYNDVENWYFSSMKKLCCDNDECEIEEMWLR